MRRATKPATTNKLRESPEWELHGLIGQQPAMLDSVVAKQTEALEKEIGELTIEADQLAKEIGELRGKPGSIP